MAALDVIKRVALARSLGLRISRLESLPSDASTLEMADPFRDLLAGTQITVSPLSSGTTGAALRVDGGCTKSVV